MRRCNPKRLPRGLASDIVSVIEGEIETQANQYAAEAWSTPEDDDTFIVAEFGDWGAVNGDLEGVGSPPHGYVLTDEGGEIPVVEGYAYREAVVDAVARKLKVAHKHVDRIAHLMKLPEEIPVSVSGSTEIYRRRHPRRSTA